VETATDAAQRRRHHLQHRGTPRQRCVTANHDRHRWLKHRHGDSRCSTLQGSLLHHPSERAGDQGAYLPPQGKLARDQATPSRPLRSEETSCVQVSYGIEPCPPRSPGQGGCGGSESAHRPNEPLSDKGSKPAGAGDSACNTSVRPDPAALEHAHVVGFRTNFITLVNE